MTTSAQFPTPPGNPLTGAANVQTTNYVILPTDAGSWIIVNSSGSVTVTLPATPPNAQFTIGVISIGTGTTTISRNGNNINGAASDATLIQNQGALFATDGTNWFTQLPTATGVTSVALSMPGIFSVAGSPITGAGTFTVTLQTQSGNVVWASPSGGGSGTPSFRSLVAADIPNLDASKIITGQLALAQGGTGVNLSSSGGTTTFLAQDSSHVISARTIVVGDLPGVVYVSTVIKTADYTALVADAGTYLIMNSAANHTIFLPSTAPTGPWWVGIINIGSGQLTINPNGLNLNGSGSNILLNTGQGTKVVTDNSNYFCGSPALSTRIAVNKTTGSLAVGATESSTVLLAKTLLLVTVTVDVPSRVRLYSTAAAATADAGRTPTTPVAAGTEHEVICDLVLNNTTGLTWILSPAAWGSDGKVSPDGNIAYNITNNNTITSTVTVTFTYIALEG